MLTLVSENVLPLQHSQYNSLLMRQVIHVSKRCSMPTAHSHILRARCKIELITDVYPRPISATVTLKMLVARKLRPKLEIMFKLGRGCTYA